MKELIFNWKHRLETCVLIIAIAINILLIIKKPLTAFAYALYLQISGQQKTRTSSHLRLVLSLDKTNIW